MPGTLLGQIRFHLGRVARELGDTTAALQQFSTFLADTATKYPELAGAEGKARFYLALTHRQVGNYDAAVTEYSKAEACFKARGETDLAVTAKDNRLWALLLAGNVEAAKELRSTYTTSPQVDTLNRAHIALLDGDHAGAVVLVRSVVDAGTTAEQRAQAYWVAAKAHQAIGDTDATSLAVANGLVAADAGDARLWGDLFS